MIPEWLLPILLNQLIQVSCVACLALLVTRSLGASRPHLVHAVWILVLLKCITPPVFSSPISPFSWAQTAWGIAQTDDNASPSHEVKRLAGEQAAGGTGIEPVVLTLNQTVLGEDAVAGRSGSALPCGKTLWQVVRSLSHVQVVLLAWLTISGAIFALILARLLKFLRLVKQSGMAGGRHSQRVERLLQRVEVKLGMRHRARIHVVDALIGPAIIGVFRPTILLPKVVVDASSDKQLETLIAHELVHFRRGDLWWSALQAIAVCCYWCNPLVWLARTIINREAEKCCDEETIGSLNCDPGEYARCLISVLECKHSLRAAPLLPGVRPVDITAKRLERIMRLRHGCHSHCPKWVLATLVLGAVVVLPGASLSLAQQDGGKDLKPASGERLPQISAAPRPAPPQGVAASLAAFDALDVAALVKASYRVESFDVTEELSKLADADSTSPQSAASALLSRLPMGEHWKSEMETTPAGVTAEVGFGELEHAIRLGGDEPCKKIVGNRLYLLGTEQYCNSVRTYLRHFRYFGDNALVYEIRIVDVLTESLDALKIDWKAPESVAPIVKAEEDAVVSASFDSVDVQTSKVAQIDPFQIVDMLNDDRSLVVIAPKISMFNEEASEIMSASSWPFVVGYAAIEDSDGKPSLYYQPEIRTVDVGFKLQLKSRVLSDDISKLQLELLFTETDIKNVETHSYELNGRTFEVQKPEVHQTSLQSTLDLQASSVIAITGTPKLVETVSEQRVPLLGDIPYFNRLFMNTARTSELRSKVLLISFRVAKPTSASEPSETSPEPSDVGRRPPMVQVSPRALAPAPVPDLQRK